MRLQLSARAQALIVLTLVAALGALVGILADRLVAQQNVPVQTAPATIREPMVGPGGAGGPLSGMPRGQMRYIEMLAQRLELTQAQQAEIDRIVAEQRTHVQQLQREMQPRFRQIAEQARTRIDGVLTESQRAELRQLRRAQLLQERQRRTQDGRPQRPQGR